MAQATSLEQLMLELVNAARAKVGAQPLAFNGNLNSAADSHTGWMLNTSTFSHTGAKGSTSTARMKAAGYAFSGSWSSGENIAWVSTRAPSGYEDEVRLLHKNLMNSPGHKANILNTSFREIGIGFKVGSYQGWKAAFATENFARSGSKIFLTGVTMDDKDGDRFYDAGEGLRGITITAVSSAGDKYTTTSQMAGGYSLALSKGTYKVTFSGSGIKSVTKSVTIGSKNMKVDLIDSALVSSTMAAAKTISGTSKSETLRGTAAGETLSASSGNDKLYGKGGKDKLVGGAGNDFLSGGTGADSFRFKDKWGADKVSDFQDRTDHIDLRGNGLTFGALSIAKVDADRDGMADDVLIRVHDQSIKLLNMKTSLIGASDFLF